MHEIGKEKSRKQQGFSLDLTDCGKTVICAMLSGLNSTLYEKITMLYSS